MCGFVQVRDCHPVGQGLFATGELRSPNGDAPFRWVYDCGSDSKPSPMPSRISAFHKECGAGRPTIDLLCLSHFDNDHISGLTELLTRFNVDTLLLPYMPLALRLIIGFGSGADTGQSQFGFFVNPVAHLDRAAAGRIRQFVFVLPHDRPTPMRVADNEPRFPRIDEWPQEQVKSHDEAQMAEFRILQMGDSQTPTGRAKILRPGSRLLVDGRWEFVPYNDALYSAKLNPAFVAIVEDLKSDLLASKKEDEIEQSISWVRDAYDELFGRSAWMRNAISLFLYSGPVPLPSADRVNSCFRVHGHREAHGVVLAGHCGFCRTLYTGDGNLSTVKRLKGLQDALGNDRVREVGFLQVAHHGSRNNWFPGLAKRLSPGLSVFSSQPDLSGLWHPHPEVVRDFLPYGPTQVDRRRALRLVCYPGSQQGHRAEGEW